MRYVYDLAGRRTNVGGSFARTGVPNALTSGSYNADNQLTQFGSSSFTYDANGNMTSDGVNAYTWNARNQLASINGNVAANFQYDAFGRRVLKDVGNASTSYLYDGVNPVQELSGTAVTANTLTGLGVDEYFGRTDASGAASLLSDALGSTVALTNSTGVLQTQYTYEPFGNTIITGLASASPFQFTGRENDANGLYFYRARYYDSPVGRFISEDPEDLDSGDINLYMYVENNPADWLDPWGLWHCVGGADCNLTPEMQHDLDCFDRCTHRDTAITSGRRPPSPRHPHGSHTRGEACDIGRNTNRDLNPDTARSCFLQCFPGGYGQEEQNQGPGTHWHFQQNPVPGGRPGFANGVQPYNP